tara:strand:+ start:307 stop:729 length:423 start_codon:yes stop_codon:yes gene_type:complete
MGLAKDIVKDVATGVMVGLIIGDEETVFPIDMIAVPAFEYAQLRAGLGSPSMMVYIKAGETLVPTGGNVADMKQNMSVEAVSKAPAAKKRKPSKWNRYVKKKANHIKLKSGKLDLKKMAKEFAKTQVKKQVKKQIKKRRK